MAFRNAKYAIARYASRLNSNKKSDPSHINDEESADNYKEEDRIILEMPEIDSIPEEPIGKSRAYEMLFGWDKATELMLLIFFLCFLVWAVAFFTAMAGRKV